MPTAATSPREMSPLAMASALTLRVFSQTSAGLCSTQPALGKICSCSICATETTLPSWSKIMHRVLVVPWSIEAMYLLTAVAP